MNDVTGSFSNFVQKDFLTFLGDLHNLGLFGLALRQREGEGREGAKVEFSGVFQDGLSGIQLNIENGFCLWSAKFQVCKVDKPCCKISLVVVRCVRVRHLKLKIESVKFSCSVVLYV